MSFSEDFFYQRSFEVVWAVFRVAEYVERPGLKHGLESRALEYLLKKTSRSLSDLSEVVQLGFKIGDISRVNARVLLREIENLKQALAQRTADEQKLLASQKSDEAPDIGDIFSSQAPMLLADIIKTGSRKHELGINEEDQENEKRTQDKERLPESGNNLAGVRQTPINESGKVPAINLGGPAKSPANIESPAKFRQSDNMSAKERRNIIFGLLKGRKLCHINDILDILPDTSRRTIRYDIQRMVDAGEVERIGKGGPNSFFRMAQNTSE